MRTIREKAAIYLKLAGTDDGRPAFLVRTEQGEVLPMRDAVQCAPARLALPLAGGACACCHRIAARPRAALYRATRTARRDARRQPFAAAVVNCAGNDLTT